MGGEQDDKDEVKREHASELSVVAAQLKRRSLERWVPKLLSHGKVGERKRDKAGAGHHRVISL